MSAASLGIEAQIEQKMTHLGFATTDLDRFTSGGYDRFDINGHEIHNGTDYFGGSVYDYEPFC